MLEAKTQPLHFPCWFSNFSNSVFLQIFFSQQKLQLGGVCEKMIEDFTGVHEIVLQ